MYGESGFLVTKKGTFTPSFDIGGDDTAFDIIVELTNFTPFECFSMDIIRHICYWFGAPHDWFLAGKKDCLFAALIIMELLDQPTPTGGTPPSTAHDNDWALYLVSGFDASADSKDEVTVDRRLHG